MLESETAPTQVDLEEIHANLPEYLHRAVGNGEEFMIMKKGQPFCILGPIDPEERVRYEQMISGNEGKPLIQMVMPDETDPPGTQPYFMRDGERMELSSLREPEPDSENPQQGGEVQ